MIGPLAPALYHCPRDGALDLSFAGDAVQGLTGHRPTAFGGDGFAALVHPDDLEPLRRARDAAEGQVEFRLRRADGAWMGVRDRFATSGAVILGAWWALEPWRGLVHDLGQPLCTIRLSAEGALARLDRGHLGEAEARRSLGRILGQAARLEAVVDALGRA